MQLSEKEVEDFIYDDLMHNGGTALENRGFMTYYHSILCDIDHAPRIKWLRQVELGPYGRLDIVGYYRLGNSIHVELFELKAVPIRTDDFEQICRYEHGIREYLLRHFKDRQIRLVFHKYLIGTSFDSGHYIHNNLEITVCEYKYNLSGIEFECHSGSWGRPDAKDYNFIKSLHNAEEIHGYR